MESRRDFYVADDDADRLRRQRYVDVVNVANASSIRAAGICAAVGGIGVLHDHDLWHGNDEPHGCGG
jgi:hypothetical protein